MSAATKVLVVDDEPFNVDLLEQALEAPEREISRAASGAEALAKAAEEPPDVVLLDVMMPGLDGFEVCRRLKADERTRDIPVIIMTALTDTVSKVEAFSLGAVDYITKPFETEEVLARVEVHAALRRARRELEIQNARLREEIEAHERSKATIEYLVEEIKTDHGFDGIVGESARLRELLEKLELVAVTDSSVLILGETGTGKELVARAIHERSPRGKRPLVKVNCAAIPRDLVESELFGHEKGAFTGATEQRKGRFELANEGSVFLDEVGELPPESQAKLLRILQDQEFERVGGTRSIHADVRVIAATNRDLAAEAKAGAFRADLFYRLNVFPLTVPPLRERREDIPVLARHFLERSARKVGKRFEGIAPAFLDEAVRYDWPGNVRELENVVERATILSRGPLLELPEPLGNGGVEPPPVAGDTLEAVERAHISSVLERTGWVVEGPRGAAAVLGLNPSTLRGRMRKLAIRKPG